jgi:hypothetical protein
MKAHLAQPVPNEGAHLPGLCRMNAHLPGLRRAAGLLNNVAVGMVRLNDQ